MPTLNWIGKDAVVEHHKEVPYHLLRCNPDLSVGEAGSGNLLVQGDNLLALKALLPYYAGQVKCIYIDPPITPEKKIGYITTMLIALKCEIGWAKLLEKNRKIFHVMILAILLFSIVLGSFTGLILDVQSGLMMAIIVGFIAGLWYGGIDVFKHGGLRIGLWALGHMPLRYVRFLDHAAGLNLLHKVGGGYIFIHRSLQEYFASLDQ